MIKTVCQRTGKGCRFCSEMKIPRFSSVGILATGQIEHRIFIMDLGQWCENDGKHYVRELEVCPIPSAISVPLVAREVSELEWMRRHAS